MSDVTSLPRSEAVSTEQEAAARPDILDTPEAGGRMIRGSAQRLIGYLVSVALGVGAIALMTRQLGVVGVGRYVTVTSLLAILVGGGHLGLNGIIIREYSAQQGAARDMALRQMLGMRIAYTVAGILVAVGFAAVAGYPDVMVAGTAVCGVSALMVAVSGNLSAALMGSMQLGWITALDLLLYGALMLTVVVLVLVGAGLLAFLGAQIPASLLVLLVSIWRVRGRMPLRPAFDRAEWNALFKRIAPFLGAALLSVVYLRLNPILISLLSTAHQTGYYGAAFRVLDVLITVPVLLTASAIPILTRAGRDDPARLRSAIKKLFDTALIAGVWMGLMVVLGARVVIDVIAGPDFGPSVAVLQILGPALVGSFLVCVCGYGLLSLHHYREILIGNAIALATMVILAVVLIPVSGARGAAVALTAAEVTLGLVLGLLLMKVEGALRFPSRLLPRLALATLLAAAPALLLNLPGIVSMILATVILIAALGALRALPMELIIELIPGARARSRAVRET